MDRQTVEISVAGKVLNAKVGETIIDALWAAGRPEDVRVGCNGGVCGACTVTVRFKDGRPGGADLACVRLVEEGMEVFPCPVDMAPAVAPGSQPGDLQARYPTLNRCTKCGSCTSACPMTIPVMDSVLRMQRGEWEQVSEDFTTCIHCGLCRFVCEDKVQPHNMGIWLRRTLGMGAASHEAEEESDEEKNTENEWSYLLTGDPKERLKRAQLFRAEGKVPQ